jgi:Uma2 family endonuclease
MTLEDYLTYLDGRDGRTELVNGALVDMGAEQALNISIVFFLAMTFTQLGIPPYRIGNKHLIAVSSTQATARDPDLTIHSAASYAAIEQSSESLLRPDDPNPMMVIEVVSPGPPGSKNYDRDYLEKRAEYAARQIREYWIIDPHRQVILVLHLEADRYAGQYVSQSFSGTQSIVSPTFPRLNLTAEQALNAGR